MFDLDTGKLLIVAVLALIVIGPKDLPRVMRQVGQAVGKLRRMSAEFQGQFMDAIKDAEIEDIRRELKDFKKAAAASDPMRDVKASLTSIKTDVETAVQAVDGDVVSPAKGFELPAVPEALLESVESDLPGTPDLAAEGVAPAVPGAEPLSLSDAASAPFEVPKRKLFIKPHRSRFARMNSVRTAELTGQAIAVRQRVVRAKKTMPHDVLSS